jgi:hypothetical protein
MRLFTFGCSITQFFYPTWADLLIEHFGTGENWGRTGAGNQYIFTRIWEADRINHFNKDDIVIVQWSSMFRDDRFIEGHGWHLAGNIFHGQLLDEPLELNNFKYKSQYQWADQMHMVMRDCAMIASIRTMLKERGCKTIFFNFSNLKTDHVRINEILNHYKEHLETDAPSIMEWNGYEHKDYIKTRPMVINNQGDDISTIRPEMHPLPFEYAEYLETFILPKLNQDKLSQNAVLLAEEYQTKLTENQPAALSSLGWTEQNTDKIGWSDD